MLYTNLSGAITALVFCAVIHPLPEPSRIIGHTQNLATLLYAILGIARTLYDIYSADADVLASQANTTRGCLCLHTCQARLLGSRIHKENITRQSKSISLPVLNTQPGDSNPRAFPFFIL
jgi:hypothetical protein